MGFLDLIIFFGYLIGITLFGISFYKKSRTKSAYTLGDSDVPSWVISMSILATFISSISYLALPGSAFIGNWNAFVFSLSIPLAMLIAVKYFVPLYRRINSPSAYTFLEKRFGPWARIYASSCYILTQLMRVGTILYLLAVTLNAILNWKISIIILITGIVAGIYSLLGGFKAVVWTDAIQGIILIAGALVTVVYILFNIPGGLEQTISIAIDHNKFSLGEFSLDLSKPTFWVVLIYGFFINLQNYGIDQNYVQRYMASKTESEAKKSALYGGLLYIPVSLIFMIIGTALFSFYNSGAASIPEFIGVNQGDQVFPHFIVSQLPSGIIGFLIASIMAAGMSTISTSINSSATVVLTDYFERYSKTPLDEKKSLRVLYLSSLCISLVGILVGVLMIGVKSALDAWWQLASIFSGGMLGLFLLGAFSRITTSKAALIGVLSGIIVIIWLTLLPILPLNVANFQIHNYLVIVFATSTIVLVGFVLSVVFGFLSNSKTKIKS